MNQLWIQYNPETGPAALPLQNFIRNNYKELKRLNPGFTFAVRERKTNPLIRATYTWGVEEERDLTGLSEKQIEKVLEDLTELGKKHQDPADYVPKDDVIEGSVYKKDNSPFFRIAY